jgi:DNA repair photolyase
MIGTGSMCDPYIQLEEQLQHTRQCLQIIEKHGFGLAIQTKSAGVLRDLDILKSINQKAKCVVQMTLTTFDEDLCRIIEPNVSTTQQRFEALQVFKNEGIPTVVWLSPILPFVNDSEENLHGILDYCIKANVRGIICFGFGVTLREGSREHFYSKLEQHFSGVKEQYVRTFGDSYECSSPNQNRLWQIFNETCRKHNILHHPNEVFAYLREFESKTQQLSLF